MYKTIAFDLDDTLLDTTGLLVQSASKAAFQHLIDQGLNLSLSECEKHRLSLIKSISHREVFEKLAQKFGSDKTLLALPKANELFYHPDIPPQLPCMDGAIENLNYLKNKYSLYIVTAGLSPAQNRKVDSLGIRSYFKKVYVVDSLSKKRKIEAFKQILLEDQIHPSELLCIGNSMSSEISDAIQLGAGSCFFDFGEDRGQSEQAQNIKPDFHIRHHSEFIKVCGL